MLSTSRELADYFEACVKLFPKPKQVSNWVMGSLLGLLHARDKTIAESPVSPENLARLLALIEEGVISGKIAKTVFDNMAHTGKPAQQIVEEKGLVQITDTDAIDDVVAQRCKFSSKCAADISRADYRDAISEDHRGQREHEHRQDLNG